MPTLLLRLLILLKLTSFFAIFASGQNLSSAVDLAALFRLRASLGLRARDWPRRADPCSSWAGVGCDGDGRVVSLNLYGLRRTRRGRRNPRFAVEGIQNLARLVSFNATAFALSGPIPIWFGSRLPPSIAVIDLRRASVSGNIPFIFAGGLTMLSLAENSITGNIPPTIAELRNLSYLDLSSNLLTGSVPLEIGALQQMNILILANNSLTGSIPQQVRNLSSLVTLDLGFNSLFGALPDGLNKLRSLRSLNLSGNLFSGSLGVNLFSSMTQLESISLSRNNFSGEIPDSLWTLSKLRFVDASYNNFTGSLPELSATKTNGSSGDLLNLSHNLLMLQAKEARRTVRNSLRREG